MNLLRSGDVELNPGPEQNVNNQTNLSVDSSTLLNFRLGQLGLIALDVGGAGDCFFKAVSHQLYGNPSHHFHIRQAAVQYLRDNPERFIESNTQNSWNGYLTNMSMQEEIAESVLANSFYIIHGKAGRSISMDSFLEYKNNSLKANLDLLGPNFKEESAQRIKGLIGVSDGILIDSFVYACPSPTPSQPFVYLVPASPVNISPVNISPVNISPVNISPVCSLLLIQPLLVNSLILMHNRAVSLSLLDVIKATQTSSPNTKQPTMQDKAENIQETLGKILKQIDTLIVVHCGTRETRVPDAVQAKVTAQLIAYTACGMYIFSSKEGSSS
ncbi:putative bifunctional UDP-N-acetylglucosamine transferase and deubiquitinase ALG13 [Stylophora pistillata]|uniref:Putative bifunctional UDP-N-acetylglucosamine transferase and deubiquitinase ALG13 n=1 Tax=Stylophora pistillata TaxID=50429 RepID=A0A2B4R9W5_STYPI|nr:putative bifunctional UDP-N-acetylglucosamine transferase and deubiquitinase ALG13 [Stylophora pistillata]